MRFVWLSWKDSGHPAAGGAETVSSHIRENLVRDGHQVTLITASYPHAPASETVQGVHILRVGNKYSVYFRARHAYRTVAHPDDIVIDEMNTIPFMAAFYAKRPVLLTYQLARQVWFYQMPFPFSVLGYLLEPISLRLMARQYALTLTESESTKTDLQRYGFRKDTVSVFRVGADLHHPARLPTNKDSDLLLFLGSMRPMKRPLDAVKAFEVARDARPTLKLAIAGSTSGPYAAKVIKYINASRHASAITVKGRISETEKTTLLQQASVIVVTSTKEGWGLIVTEANAQGTPAVVYDTDGLRDSVVSGKTGITVPSGDYSAMGIAVAALLSDRQQHTALARAAFEHSKQFTFETSYNDFMGFIESFVAK